jgi:FkbM family methyltransferase
MNASRFFNDPAFRHWLFVWFRHRRRPRYTAGRVKAFGYELEVADEISVVHQFLDIFANHEYRMPALGRGPVIVDVGANVGVSVLYHCRHLDDPEIHAFEPDPGIFSKLRQNIERYAADKRVVLNNQAAYTRTARLRFTSEGADGGHLQTSVDAASTVEVDAIDLLHYLTRFVHIDFLKFDIEGAEGEVVLHCAPIFPRVDRVFVEYHSLPGQDQKLPQILTLLKESGFRFHLQSAETVFSPFTPQARGHFDNQVNVFAYRQKP